MRNSRGMKFTAILALVGILALGLATPGFSQTILGVKPGQAPGDPAKTSLGPPTGPNPGYSYVVLGVKPGQTPGDPAKTSVGPRK